MISKSKDAPVRHSSDAESHSASKPMQVVTITLNYTYWLCIICPVGHLIYNIYIEHSWLAKEISCDPAFTSGRGAKTFSLACALVVQPPVSLGAVIEHSTVETHQTFCIGYNAWPDEPNLAESQNSLSKLPSHICG